MVRNIKNKRKWLQFCPPHLKTVATLPCEMQKSYFGRLQQWMHTGSACVSSE